VDVTFACPICNRTARASLPAADWQCPACDHRLTLEPRSVDAGLGACVVCGNPELYKKKDFPHWLGMTILIVACVASIITYGFYEKWLTWAILLGSAAFDGLLYLWVGDAVVCYRCNAHYRGFTSTEAHRPFDLGTAERYRQERLRKELLKQGSVPSNSKPQGESSSPGGSDF
jgi:DNA-directed RNA polymerase subunit RPC12/RpoP